MTIFSKAWFHIKAFFDEAENEVIEFIDSLTSSILRNGGKFLIDSARAAVQEVANNGSLDTDQKFITAFEKVKESLEKNGLPIVFNAINGAIEAAVAENKNQQKKIDG